MKNLFSLLVIMLTFSCSSVDEEVNPITQEPVNVYIGGQKNNAACVWKNNQALLLPGGIESQVDALLVVNDTVHAFGKKYTDIFTTEYLYWKNNVLTNLNSAFHTSDQVVRAITGMEVADNDVYFVGYTKNPLIAAEIYDLAYWKNGVKTVLQTALSNPNFNAKIKVVNNTVYVSGTTTNCFDSCIGVYTNGVFAALPVGTFIKDFAVNNNEVYVYGSNTTTNSGFYKNITTGVETNLTTITAVENMHFDANYLYNSSLFEIYKNSVSLYSAPLNDILITFTVKNNNLYVIEGSNSQIMKINDVIAISAVGNERFTSLFVQ